MKTLKSILYLLSAVGILGGFSSCNDDPETDKLSGQQIYFNTTLASTVEVELNQSSVTIPVERMSTVEKISVPIFSSDESGIFTIPSEVTFAAGQKTANIVITYSFSGLQPDKAYPLTLTIGDKENASPYGMTAYAFNLLYPAPWTSLGKASYTEDILTAAYGIDNVTFDVEVQESDQTPGLYRLKNLFHVTSEFFELYGFKDGHGTSDDYYIEINCTNASNVTIARQPLGFTMDAYGALEIMSAQGGTIKNGVIKFPANGLTLVVPSVGGIPTNASGAFKIVLPDGIDLNPEVALEYMGSFTGADNVSSAVLKLTPSEDVVSYKYTVLEGFATANEVATTIAGIKDGSVESSEMESSGKEENLAIVLEKTGKYTAVVVPYGDGNYAGEGTSVQFKFSTGGEGVPDAPLATLEITLDEPMEGYDNMTSIFYTLKGENVVAGKSYCNKASVITGSGMSPEDIILQYGKDLSEKAIKGINSEEGYSNGFINLSPGETYTMIFLVTNEDGVNTVKSATKTTDEESIPDDPTSPVALGKYSITIDTTPSYVNNVTVTKGEGENAGKYILTNLFDTAIALIGTYDDATKTVTFDGSAIDEEESIFYMLLGYANADKTLAYAMLSGDDGEQPLVINVVDRHIKTIGTYIQLGVFDITKEPAEYKGYMERLQVGAEFTPKTAAAPTSFSSRLRFTDRGFELMSASSDMIQAPMRAIAPAKAAKAKKIFSSKL